MSLFKLLPAEVQAACAERIPGLCTSGQACQFVRQGVEGGRVACYGKRAACMPRGRLRAAVSIPDPHPASATSGLTEHCHAGQRRASGVEGYHHPVTASGAERQHGSKGQCSCLFIEIFPFRFTCLAALHSLLPVLSLQTQPLEGTKGI